MFALVLMEPNQLMSITEVNDGPGAAVDGLMALIGFVVICVLFIFLDLFFHLFLRHNKFDCLPLYYCYSMVYIKHTSIISSI